MATAETRLVSADEFFDFVNLPENRDRFFELEAGEIVEMPRPGERHGAICGNLAGLFFIYFRQIKSGRVLANDTGLVLERDPDTVRGPDLAIYTDIKKYADLSTKYPDDLPTLVIEVLSPSDRFFRAIPRLNRFIEKGVNHVWLVDPETRTVTIWWEGHAPILFQDTDEIGSLPGLPEFRCRVSEVFDAPGS